MASFTVSSSKYHRMNRYRFPKIFATFERKILNIEEATATCSVNAKIVQMSHLISVNFSPQVSHFTCQNMRRKYPTVP